MPLEDEFGDVIGKARRGHGLSPSAVASAVGLTEDALAAIERYERLPTRDEVGQFARLFSLPADRLWDIATEAWDAPHGATDDPPARLAPYRMRHTAVSGALLSGGGNGRLVSRHRHWN